ncbi:MAG: hypothetical protein IJO55_04110 [Lachnospiraceae bacterium]|nr:hypothetical protein [Lachnospiraceae bacterium]
MNDVDVFLEVFGGFTIAEAMKFLIAVAAVIYACKKFSDYLTKKHDAEMKKNEQLEEALSAVKKYPEYRQQSIAIQKQWEQENKDIRKTLEEVIKRLDDMEEDTKRRERNKCRDRLLQSFRYYTNKEKNPMQAWTRMESEAFWEQFKDYENMDGNGYMHSDVQPAMNLLGVIEMDDTEHVAALMKSRG